MSSTYNTNIRIRTWNVKGVNNVVKRKKILNILKRDKINIALLQETHLNDLEHQKFRRDWVGQLYYSSFSSKKRGVIILIHKNLPFQLQTSYSDKEGRTVIIKGLLYGEEVVIANIYAPNIYDEDYFAQVYNKIAYLDCNNVILGGDFNCYLNPDMDKSPAVTIAPKAANIIKTSCQELGLIDIWRFLNPTVKDYTFYSYPHQSASRIDYIFFSNQMVSLAEKSNIGPITLSDHAPVTVIMSPPRPNYQSWIWKLNPFHLLDGKFVDYLREQTKAYFQSNDTNGMDPRTLWEAYKAFLRGMIIAHISKKKKELLFEQMKLEKKIITIEKEFHSSNSAQLLAELKSLRVQLNQLLTRKADKDILFARQRFFEMGNKPNRFLARLVKKMSIKGYISAIKDPSGCRITENKKISETFRQYYEKLYSSDINTQSKLENTFFKDLCIPKINNKQKELLEAPITLLEIKTAINSLQSGKSPGPDGYPVEFFKIMNDKISPYLLKAINTSFHASKLPNYMNIANITVIHKKEKDPEECSSYRPISLLNVDLKVLAKILAKRLEHVIPDIIDPDQTGFIKGRHSYCNTRRLFNIICHLNRNLTPGILVAMDAEKAFDRVEWSYMFDVMSRFGIGENFIKWVRLLYTSPKAAVLTNGVLSDSFALHRGTRQGCPLSPLLFAIAIEPLAIYIRNNQKIYGVSIGNRQQKILLYADDILLTITNPLISLPELTDLIKQFGVISGYKVNFHKSEIMPLGSLDVLEPNFIKPFKWSPSGITYLGILITPKLSHLYDANIKTAISRIKEDFTRWSKLPISFSGRINLIKMIIFPKILYPLSMTFSNLTNADIKDLNRSMSKFIWASKRPKVKLQTLQLPTDKGGWSLPNFKYYIWAIQARIILDWVHKSEDALWVDIEQEFCNPVSLINLLDQKTQIPDKVKENPLIIRVVKTWSQIRRSLKYSQNLPILSTLASNTNFHHIYMGSQFGSWINLGIYRIFDLFHKDIFMSFDELHLKHNIPKKDFFKYLQIRHFVHTRHGSLTLNSSDFFLDRFFLRNTEVKHFISKFYSMINQYKADNLISLQKAWSKNLKCDIDENVWDDIIRLPLNISVCNRFKEMQFNIVHRAYISPNRYSKVNNTVSPQCPKCNDSIGTFFHCLWECPLVADFWNGVCDKLSIIYKQKVTASPLMCLLGVLPSSFLEYSDVFKPLLMLGRKLIMNKWVGTEPPLIKDWIILIKETILMEKIGHILKGKSNSFQKLWEIPLNCLGIDYKSTMYP